MNPYPKRVVLVREVPGAKVLGLVVGQTYPTVPPDERPARDDGLWVRAANGVPVRLWVPEFEVVQ